VFISGKAKKPNTASDKWMQHSEMRMPLKPLLNGLEGFLKRLEGGLPVFGSSRPIEAVISLPA
jgi:hypothetical protein